MKYVSVCIYTPYLYKMYLYLLETLKFNLDTSTIEL